MAERTLRRPKRPKAYAALILLAALVLAAGVAGTWSLAQRLDPMAGRPVVSGGSQP
jgi:hypothetical protein